MDKLLSICKEIDSALNEFIQLTASAPENTIIGKRTLIGERQHIAFWHKYYADNLEAVQSGNNQPLFKETYIELEKRCVEELGDLDFDDLAKLMKSSQLRIKNSVKNGVTKSLKYKYGSRLYTPEEYLETILSHLNSHNVFLVKELSTTK